MISKLECRIQSKPNRDEFIHISKTFNRGLVKINNANYRDNNIIFNNVNIAPIGTDIMSVNIFIIK